MNRKVAPQALMIFVDGLGAGSSDSAVNPLAAGAAPVLVRYLKRFGHPMAADMGVPGLPQSATGQTALLTGCNAARFLGRHVEGFPGPRLRPIIREHNLFCRLLARGYRATFANAYYLESPSPLARRGFQSVTTVAALAAFGAVRDERAMAAGQAVSHDLTRQALRARGYGGPLRTPEEAADDLVRIAAEQDFTLFEFFETDRVGHRGSWDEAMAVLNRLDQFFARLSGRWRGGRRLLILTSDHGNIERMDIRTHTPNPAVFAASGWGAPHLRARVRRIEEVTSALMALFPPRSAGEDGGAQRKGGYGRI